MRIVHVITGLERHGAELMLQRLVVRLDQTRFNPSVVSLTTLGSVGAELRGLGVEVDALNMPGGVLTPLGVSRLGYILWRRRPDVVQTWLYHADLVGGIVARASTRAAVVWSVRQEALDSRAFKLRTRWTARACARLAPIVPHHVLYCSSRAAASHIALGYPAERATVIPNGFDLDLFHPDPVAYSDVRSELELPADSRLVGLFGRFNPQKEHFRFLRGLADVRRSLRNVYGVLAGHGITSGNGQLMAWVDQLGLAGALRLLGPRNDVPRLTAALDVAVSASAPGEGFPNVVGEAMACAVPCVVTESGESAMIVADTGRVVQKEGSAPMAEAIADLIRDDAARRELGQRARRRIEAEFALPSVVRRYETFYGSVAGTGRTVTRGASS